MFKGLAVLPHDLLPKSTVYDYFVKWRDHGLLQRIVDGLRRVIRQQTPRAPGDGGMREPTPRAACVDSQSVKATEVGGEGGYDGAKRIKGRKRHVVVDTLGRLLAVAVTAANVEDAVGAQRVVGKLAPEDFPRWEAIFGDQKYHNYAYYAWLQEPSQGRWRMEISSPPRVPKNSNRCRSVGW
jgi:putative transposase